MLERRCVGEEGRKLDLVLQSKANALAEEIHLAAEVMVGLAQRHLRPGRDLPQSCAVEAFLYEELARRFQDAAAGCGRVGSGWTVRHTIVLYHTVV